jgi:hypothetical protein
MRKARVSNFVQTTKARGDGPAFAGTTIFQNKFWIPGSPFQRAPE